MLKTRYDKLKLSSTATYTLLLKQGSLAIPLALDYTSALVVYHCFGQFDLTINFVNHGLFTFGSKT